MKEFVFDEVKHAYFLDGKPMMGCTTVLGVIAKPALIPWAVKMCGDYVMEHHANVVAGVTPLKDMVDEAKRQWRSTRDKAGQQGTDVHKEIEDICLEAMRENNGFIKDQNHESVQVQHFIDWAVRNKVKIHESEIRTYSEKHWVAGTADLILEIDGLKYVGDIKTSSGIYDEAFYQMAAYRMMLEEHGHTEFQGGVVINLKKNGTFDEDKDVVARTDYQGDLSAFLGALAIYKQKNAYK